LRRVRPRGVPGHRRAAIDDEVAHAPGGRSESASSSSLLKCGVSASSTHRIWPLLSRPSRRRASPLTRSSRPSLLKFPIRFYFTKAHVRGEVIRLVKVLSEENVADIFTKVLGWALFQAHRVRFLFKRSDTEQKQTKKQTNKQTNKTNKPPFLFLFLPSSS